MKLNILRGVGTSSPQGGNAPLTPFILCSFKKNWYEAEAIVLAMELKADLLLMDERRGRALAANVGLSVTGLLGVLLQAKSRGLILLIKPLLDQLVEEADFRVGRDLYERVLEESMSLLQPSL